MNLFLIILATVISTILGGFFAIKFKDKLHLILGFSAGTLLGVTIFDLLPEAINLGTTKYTLETVMLFTALGFGFYLTLDRFFSLHSHDCEGEGCEKPLHNGKLGAATLILHSFLDGLGIGLAFKISSTVGWAVALAVLAHKFSDGINTVNVLLLDKKRKKEELWRWLTAVTLVPALGLLSAFLVSVTPASLGLVLSVFVGLFLYISASELIPESHHHHPTLWTTLSTLIGIILMFFISRFSA
jgi:ZIP family zinc transporter